MAEPIASLDNGNDSETVVYLGDDIPVTLKSTSRSRGPSESKTKTKNDQKPEFKTEETFKNQQVKRGQKGKLKKIKEKYKDQDEEERKLRMDILHNSRRAKDSKKSKKKQEQINMQEKQAKKTRMPKPQVVKAEDDDETEEVQVATEVDMVDSLTGIPCLEDELLFSVPVVAPYNTLVNYK